MAAPINRVTPAGKDIALQSAPGKPNAAGFDKAVAENKAKAAQPSPSPEPPPPKIGGDPRPLPGPGDREGEPNTPPPRGTVIQYGSMAENVARKIWNSPNTAVGLIEGGAGYVAGMANYALGGQKEKPGVNIGNNAIQFTNNPAAKYNNKDAQATTSGNVILYAPSTNPRDQNIQDHERQHTYQGEAFGPFLLPAYVAAGAAASIREKFAANSFQGPKNFFETGPYSNPPRPWP